MDTDDTIIYSFIDIMCNTKKTKREYFTLKNKYSFIENINDVETQIDIYFNKTESGYETYFTIHNNTTQQYRTTITKLISIWLYVLSVIISFIINSELNCLYIKYNDGTQKSNIKAKLIIYLFNKYKQYIDDKYNIEDTGTDIKIFR